MSDTPSRVCGQPAADGSTFCRNHTTQWFEGHGWRCRFHLPEGQTWPHARRGVSDRVADDPTQQSEQPDPLPNDGRLETLADAKAMIQWATREVALGRISESRSRATCNGAMRFINSIVKVEKADQMDRVEGVLVAMGKLKATK